MIIQDKPFSGIGLVSELFDPPMYYILLNELISELTLDCCPDKFYGQSNLGNMVREKTSFLVFLPDGSPLPCENSKVETNT